MARLSKPAILWNRELAKRGYEAPATDQMSAMRFARLSRVWWRILLHTGYHRFDPIDAFEVGCGGGAQVVPLYVNGWHCVALDSSKAVIRRAKEYVRRAAKVVRPKGTIEFVISDFARYQPGPCQYDIVFHFGVLEHFLVKSERIACVRKMFQLTKVGGYVVAVVPCGTHLLRSEQRRLGWGGYRIPEIDYSKSALEQEMLVCGASCVKVLHHNMFGYLAVRRGLGRVSSVLLGIVLRLVQYVPWGLFSSAFRDRHAYSLVGIARK